MGFTNVYGVPGWSGGPRRTGATAGAGDLLWCAGGPGGQTFLVDDPRAGAPIALVADAGPVEGAAAVASAWMVQPRWAERPAEGRRRILMRAATLLGADAAAFARLLASETGMPIAAARGEVCVAVDHLRWYGEEAVRIRAHAWAVASAAGSAVVREPIGPCGLITPCDAPLATFARKVAPALAAGCTAIVQPAAEAPLSVLCLGRLLGRAGLPPGVLSVLATSRPAMLQASLHGPAGVRRMSFTGAASEARAALRSADASITTVVEVLGNVPFVVFADADVDAAVDAALLAGFPGQLDARLTPNRFIVHASLQTAFSLRLAKRTGQWHGGPGGAAPTALRPLVARGRLDRLGDLVDEAVRGGAVALGGVGHPLPPRGYFHRPTVLMHVDPSAEILQEHLLGPVAPVVAFQTVQEAVALASVTGRAPTAYIFTGDRSLARRALTQIEASLVVVNRAVPDGLDRAALEREDGGDRLEDHLAHKRVALDQVLPCGPGLHPAT